MQKPTAGLPDAYAHPANGDAGPPDGNPATPTRDAAPAADARRALSTLSRTLRLAPRPETAVRRPGAHPVRGASRGIRRPSLRGAIPGQLALFEGGTSGLRDAATGVFDTIRRQERSVAVLVAFIVLLAVVTATIPTAGAAGASGATDGLGQTARLSVGAVGVAGGAVGDGVGPIGAGEIVGAGEPGIEGAVPSAAPGGRQLPADELQVPTPADQGAFLPDGTYGLGAVRLFRHGG